MTRLAPGGGPLGVSDQLIITEPLDNPHALTVTEGAISIPVFTGRYEGIDPVTGSLSGPNQGLFGVDSAADGVFELSMDTEVSSGDYSFVLRITSTDGTFDERTFNVTVAVVGSAPTITSNGGGPTATILVPEGTTAVTTVVATGTGTMVYSKSGTDAGKFNINSSSGALVFAAAKDYESPDDANTDRDYLVTVTATGDTSPADTQDLTVRLTNVAEPGDGGGVPLLANAGMIGCGCGV